MQLSENKIKQIMLRYLKQHYKYRLGADGKAIAKIDQRGAGGIIADGYLSFQVEEGTDYLATFEATSLESKAEVFYQGRTKILLWDCASFGLSIITIIYLVLYFWTQLSVKTHGIWTNIGFVMAGIFVFGLLYFLIFRNNRRYRYIYAIEQFKQYYADDQWIAIGDDVFGDEEELAREELKDQCILNGFGLVTIDQEEAPLLIIAPARQAVFQKKRKQLQFVDRQETLSQRTFQSAKSLWDRIWSLFSKRSGAWSFLRFQSASYTRIFLMGFAASILGFIFWRQISDTEFDYLNQKEWDEAISTIDGKKEGNYYIAGADNISSIEETETDYLDLLPEQMEDNIDPELSNIEIFMASDSRLFTYYDCSRLYNFKETKYLIKWGSFSEFDVAKDHVIRLMQKGIRCNVIWHGCFDGAQEGYIVFLDLVHSTNETAVRKANFLQAWLGKEGEQIKQMSILVIRQNEERKGGFRVQF